MKRIASLLPMILTAAFLQAQEVPFAENEETAMVGESETSVTPDGDSPSLTVTAAVETDGSRSTSAAEDETAGTDDALVWDAETGDGEESLADAAASTAEIPIRLRAEAAARKEWSESAAAVGATDAETKLVLAVLTDIHVKAIRITEDTQTNETRKKILLNSLAFEKKNRIRSVLDKERYKIYRRLQKNR